MTLATVTDGLRWRSRLYENGTVRLREVWDAHGFDAFARSAKTGYANRPEPSLSSRWIEYGLGIMAVPEHRAGHPDGTTSLINSEANVSKGLENSSDTDQCAQLAMEQGWLWNPPKQAPDDVRATLILAHGAGAPMDSAFMNDMAGRLADLGIGVLRFEFPYMALRRIDGGKRPPNPQPTLLACWREVYEKVRLQCSGWLAIGGKSMGGRMASLIADELKVDALVCLGYPFYAVGKPEKPRVAHLADLKTPTLIIQGERDALGNRETVDGYTLSSAIEVYWLPTANHDLKPLKAAGVSHETCLQDAAEHIARRLLS